MKINGKKLDQPYTKVIAFPREGEDLVFVATAITSYDEFHRLCPEPRPKLETKPGMAPKPLFNDPKYVAEHDKWYSRKAQWMIIESLKDSPGLEWESVDRLDPETWSNVYAELESAKFTDIEQAKLTNTIFEVNGYSDSAIEAAKQRFFVGQQEKAQ
jgi:hypothetical protein